MEKTVVNLIPCPLLTDESDLNMDPVLTPPSNESGSIKGSPETLIET